MALMITANRMLDRVRRLGRSGTARSAVVSGSAGAVGLIAGKRGGLPLIPTAAAGAAAFVLGMDPIAQGVLGAAACMEGYKRGAAHTARRQIADAETPGVRRRPRG